MKMHAYWTTWFFLWFTTFIIPELIAVFSGHDENTLSFAVWDMEGKTLGNGNPLTWSFPHVAFTSVFIVLVIWLIGHFGWGIWR